MLDWEDDEELNPDNILSGAEIDRILEKYSISDEELDELTAGLDGG